MFVLKLSGIQIYIIHRKKFNCMQRKNDIYSCVI